MMSLINRAALERKSPLTHNNQSSPPGRGIDRKKDNTMEKKYCDLCGKELIPGTNWYTLCPDHVCMECRPVNYPAPEFSRKVFRYTDIDADYEEAILARQEDYND